MSDEQPAGVVDVGDHYARCRRRIRALVVGAGPAAADAGVEACPGWSVRDVVSHLVGVVEDSATGRLRGLPSAELTAEQVLRHRRTPVADLMSAWDAIAPQFDEALRARQVWPALMDIVSHEHDIRTALGRPGARDIDTVRSTARRAVAGVTASYTLRVTFDDGSVCSSTPADDDAGVGDVYELRCSHFEVLRLRLGRRSRGQVTDLAWSRDPSRILDDLFIFGPRSTALAEPGPPITEERITDPSNSSQENPCSS